MGRIKLILIFIISIITAKESLSHIIYKDKADRLGICSVSAGILEHCQYKKVPHNTIYAVNNGNIYIHDMSSNNYQLCKIDDKSIVNCSISMIDNFKATKIIVINSRLYMLGNTVRSCTIGNNNNIGKCINENNLPIDSHNSNEYYTNIKQAPSIKNDIILTRKTATTETNIDCEIKEGRISSCKNIENGNYQVIPKEKQYIYRLEPKNKSIIVCYYEPNSGVISNCTPAISNFDIVAEHIEFTITYDDNRKKYIHIFFTDMNKKTLVRCSVNEKNYTIFSCSNWETSEPVESSSIIFDKTTIPPQLSTYYMKDGLNFSGADGKLSVLCNSIGDKKIICKQHKNNSLLEESSAIFIGDYAPDDSIKKQYAYMLDKTGTGLKECSFDPDDLLTGEINNCETRKDIIFPVKIISGKVLKEAHMLLLTGENSDIYQCNYTEKNRLKSCQNIGLVNFEFTHISFSAANQKIYFYSKKNNKMNACNIVGQSISNCYSVSLDSSITDDTVRDTAISSDVSHILLADKSTINYCSLNCWEPRLEKCIRLSNHFSNITSLAYSKISKNFLYVLDNNIMKVCLIKDNKINCEAMILNDKIAKIPADKFTVSANYLRTGLNLLPLRIKNKGGYILKATYSTYSKNESQRLGATKQLALGHQFTRGILGGSAVELYALSGKTKCIIVDEPGEVSCTRSTFTMACYYNGSSKKVMDGSCPLTSFKIACTPQVIKRLKNLTMSNHYKVNEREGKITFRRHVCWSILDCSYEYDEFNCYDIMKKIQQKKPIRFDL